MQNQDKDPLQYNMYKLLTPNFKGYDKGSEQLLLAPQKRENTGAHSGTTTLVSSY